MLSDLYNYMISGHPNNRLKHADFTGKVMGMGSVKLKKNQQAHRFGGQMFFYGKDSIPKSYTNDDGQCYIDVLECPMRSKRNTVCLKVRDFENLTECAYFNQDLLPKISRNLPDDFEIGEELAGTLLQSHRKDGVGGGCISIVERGHSPHSVVFDWVMHVPVSGTYWVVMAVPKGVKGLPDQMSDHTREFQRWMGGMAGSSPATHEYLITICRSLLPNNDFFHIKAMKCTPGNMFLFPASHWNHFFIEVGAGGKLATFVMHSFRKDAAREQELMRVSSMDKDNDASDSDDLEED